ncbi:head GIN domain-containing protein [Ascidiimonas aurantiaca]|uniref:head GIN domain-containing protein n=1 Tax=Ascidiimonas aurantiaca TaxID=1685432 RepID=UPI0030EF5D87
MKKLFYSLVLVLCFSCDSENAPDCFQTAGPIITEQRQVPEFSRILVNEGIELIVKQDTEYTVKVETGENLMNDIDVKVEEGRLLLTDNNICNFVRDYGITTIYVTAPDLKEIRSSTQFDVRSDGVLSYPEFSVISEDFLNRSLQSVGNFYLEIDTETFRLVFNNLSNCFIKGKSQSINLQFQSGNGRFEGADLVAENATIFHRGTNDMIIQVNNKVAGNIFGTGNIVLVKKPLEIEVIEHYRGRLIIRE